MFCTIISALNCAGLSLKHREMRFFFERYLEKFVSVFGNYSDRKRIKIRVVYQFCCPYHVSGWRLLKWWETNNTKEGSIIIIAVGNSGSASKENAFAFKTQSFILRGALHSGIDGWKWSKLEKAEECYCGNSEIQTEVIWHSCKSSEISAFCFL